MDKCSGCGKRIWFWNRSPANSFYHRRCIKTRTKTWGQAIAWADKQNKNAGYPTATKNYFSNRNKIVNAAKIEEIKKWCDDRIEKAKSIQHANEILANSGNHILEAK